MLLILVLFILFDCVIVLWFSEEEVCEMDEIVEVSNIVIVGYGCVGGIVVCMLWGVGFNLIVIDFSVK